MRFKGILYFLIIFCFCIGPMRGQDTLYLNDYLELIGKNYPLIKKADLYNQFTEAYSMKAKGVLDPKASANFDKKFFDDTNYFSVWQSEAKIPTRFPVDFSVGYENNDGVFLNEENNVPSQGLVYGTFNVSILRGLIYDDQRYQIREAELKGIKSQIERQNLTREIIIQATKTYIEWAAAYENLQAYTNYLQVINDRHQNIILLFENGDKPAIDTLESRVNLNTGEKLLLDNSRELLKKQQKLTLFLWNDNGNPLQIQSNVAPERKDSRIQLLNTLALIVNPQFNNDPKLRKIDNEIEMIEIKNKLDREYLKPQLDLKYNTIVNLGKEDLDPSFTFNDYKYGINIEVPIRNRKAKSEIQLNEVMIAQAQLDQTQYLQTLINKYQILLGSQVIQENILSVVDEKIRNSQALYEAEQLKFDLGESSVFLLNKRELKLLEAQIDEIKSHKKLSTILADLYYLKMAQ